MNGKTVRPFHKLVEPIKDPRMEGLDESNIHRFFHNLVSGLLFDNIPLGKMQLLGYEENIVHHTQRINEKRERKVTWKYFQWLTLLFSEIYLDKYFNDREGLLSSLNDFVARFNRRWDTYADVPPYTEDDLNKLCYQNATGSGKTLIMHVNLLQYQHYAERAGQADDLSRVILLTPNERLSEQHLGELAESDIASAWFVGGRNTLFTMQAGGLRRVDVMEITKLAEQDGPQQIATRSLGDENLLLVDEGHRGMSGKEEGAWFSRRNSLCAKGFTSEYSATFEQAVAAAKNEVHRERLREVHSVRLLVPLLLRGRVRQGLPDSQSATRSFADVVATYLTACLLKFYQQLRIYEERGVDLKAFNIEKPLWVFVGSSVQKASGSRDEQEVASDVAKVLQFVADFLHEPDSCEGSHQSDHHRDRPGYGPAGPGRQRHLRGFLRVSRAADERR